MRIDLDTGVESEVYQLHKSSFFHDCCWLVSGKKDLENAHEILGQRISHILVHTSAKKACESGRDESKAPVHELFEIWHFLRELVQYFHLAGVKN